MPSSRASVRNSQPIGFAGRRDATRAPTSPNTIRIATKSADSANELPASSSTPAGTDASSTRPLAASPAETPNIVQASRDDARCPARPTARRLIAGDSLPGGASAARLVSSAGIGCGQPAAEPSENRYGRAGRQGVRDEMAVKV